MVLSVIALQPSLAAPARTWGALHDHSNGERSEAAWPPSTRPQPGCSIVGDQPRHWHLARQRAFRNGMAAAFQS
jgi:hypothetical protein